MDFIKDSFEKMKKNIAGYGMKKALVFYLAVSTAATFSTVVITIWFFYCWKYMVQELEVDNAQMIKSNYLTALAVVLVATIIVVSVVTVSHLYYKKKLEEPLRILHLEMEYLEREDLSFDCSYLSEDEMGEVCAAMNKMRLQLIQNQANTWKMIESERELHAAFAHDVRTPLTVMKGYNQMLLKYERSGRLSREKLIHNLELMEHQIERLENFADMMKEINGIENWKVQCRTVSLGEAEQALRKTIQRPDAENIRIVMSEIRNPEVMINLDLAVLQEVGDNLISNALRFAKREIQVELKLEQAEQRLFLFVKDDGAGFTKTMLENGLRPYFTTEKGHSGIGLTISRMLCRKHGGNLELMNGIEGGGIVCAYFQVMEKLSND